MAHNTSRVAESAIVVALNEADEEYKCQNRQSVAEGVPLGAIAHGNAAQDKLYGFRGNGVYRALVRSRTM